MGEEFSWEEYEESASLVECTCEHSPEEHDWGNCILCNCLGHWEE